MAETLSQSQAEALIRVEKVRVTEALHDFPAPGAKLSVPLQSRLGRENFLLDIHRGRIDLWKGTYQNRARQVIPLVRLDFGGPPHRNPDDELIPPPHMHVYREDFGDKWAVRINDEFCDDLSDLWSLLHGFYAYCNIVQPPNLRRGLW
ncbi:MAG: hypothetical protein RLN76_01125 [Phycisphaeraceae bacterium]